MQIKSQTWSRDSYGLFDYENHKVKSNTNNVNECGFLIRKKNDVKFVKSIDMPTTQMIPGEDSELSKLIVKDSKFNQF